MRSEHRPAELHITAPATEGAARWEGFGTALKPGQEMWWLARKPLKGTVAANVLQFGTGALNIAACKVAHASAADLATSQSKNPGRTDKVTSGTYGADRPQQSVDDAGRWPTNIVFTHSQGAWYALRYDISADIRQAVLAYYRSTEGVREVRDGLLRDAIRASKTPLLFSGLRERGEAGRPREAVGAGDLSAVRRDVRDLSGMGASGRRKYCSAKCRGRAQTVRLNRTGKRHTAASRAKMGTNPATRERSSQWKGGRYQNGDGYWFVMIELLPPEMQALARQMTKGLYIQEHRIVAAATIGRPVTKGEVVHHINGEKTDNRPENLIVTTRANHSQEHREIEKRFAMLMAEVETLRAENASLRSRLTSSLLAG